MSVRITLVCDHRECTNRFESRFAGTQAAALTDALGDGWRRTVTGQDQCPEHAKNTMVTPVRESL